jgi:hypothetical protein
LRRFARRGSLNNGTMLIGSAGDAIELICDGSLWL